MSHRVRSLLATVPLWVKSCATDSAYSRVFSSAGDLPRLVRILRARPSTLLLSALALLVLVVLVCVVVLLILVRVFLVVILFVLARVFLVLVVVFFILLVFVLFVLLALISHARILVMFLALRYTRRVLRRKPWTAPAPRLLARKR